MVLLILSVILVITLNALMLVTYRAFTVGQPSGSFYLPLEGNTVLLFGTFLLHVHRTSFWKNTAYVFFPIEYGTGRIPGLWPFTDWFSKHPTAPTDLAYVIFAALGLPLKLIWGMWLLLFGAVLRPVLALSAKRWPLLN